MYEDKTSELTFKDVSLQSFKHNFKSLQSHRLAFDITTSVVWIKFKMVNQSQIALYLELSSPTIHQVEYYLPYAYGNYKQYSSGFLKNYSSRPIQIDRFTFPVSNEGDWHYIRLQSDHFLNTKFEIKSMQEVLQGASTREFLYLLYGVLMLAIIAGVLFYVYLIRYSSYFLYIGYIFFISSINLTEKGFYFQALWPENPAINFYFPILPFGVSVCLLLFLKNIWQPDYLVKTLFNLNFWIVTVLPLFAVLYLLGDNKYGKSILITQVHSFTMCLFVLVTSLVSHARSTSELKRFHKLIIAGVCVFCLGVMIYILSQNHILPVSKFTENSILIGSSLEVCFFTAALYIHSDTIYRSHKNRLQQTL